MSREQVLDIVRSGQRFLVTCHIRPDADALGSALGFAAMLRALGKTAVVYSQGGTPPQLHFLEGSDAVQAAPPEEPFDATFIMDTAARVLVPALRPREERGPLVVVDHHAANDGFGDLFVREVDACATGEVLLRLWEELAGPGAPVPRPAAQPIYAAIAADTGCFRYPGTTGDTLRLGARLLDLGVSTWQVNSHLFERWPHEKMVLLGEVLRSMEVLHGGDVVLVSVPRSTFVAAGASDEMLEGLVNYGRMLDGVRVAALLWEPNTTTSEHPEVKVSFRSDGETNVAAIAALLGGGGHRVAAAAGLSSPLEEARERVLSAILSHLDG